MTHVFCHSPTDVQLRRHRGESRTAFTFPEMLVVLLISGILVAAAVPKYNNAIFQYRADAASKRIAADITFAQRQALSLSCTQTITFIPNGGSGLQNSYTIPNVKYVNFAASGVTVDLNQDPYKVTLVSATFGVGAVLTIDRYGLPANSGSIVVQAGSYTKTISVDGTTGRVTIN